MSAASGTVFKKLLSNIGRVLWQAVTFNGELFKNGAYKVATVIRKINYAYITNDMNTDAGYMQVVSTEKNVAGGQHIATFRITDLIDITDFNNISADFTLGTAQYVPQSTRLWISVHSAIPDNVYNAGTSQISSYSCVKSNTIMGSTSKSLALNIADLKGSYYLAVGCEYNLYNGACDVAGATLQNWILT